MQLQKSKKYVFFLALAIIVLGLVIGSHLVLTQQIGKSLSTLPNNQTSFSTSNGEKYQWQSVPIGGGGFVTGLLIHPSIPDLVYARTDVGGIFRWQPESQSWRQLLSADTVSTPVSYSIESMAVDPQDPDIIYIASGAYTQHRQKLVSGILLKSSNRGESWQKLNLSVPMGGNESWRWAGERLAVDPHNSNVIYFGSRLDGLWYTQDGGNSWNQVDANLVPKGEAHPETKHRAGITYVTFDPLSGTINGKTKVIYAGVAGHGIYQTTDAGKNWHFLPQGASPDLIPQQGVVNSRGELITTFYRHKDNPGGGVWKFSRQGWQDITPKKGKNYSAVAVAPHQPQQLFAVTYPLSPQGIYRSEDGGKNWISVKNKLDKLPWHPNWLIWGLSGTITVSPFHPQQVWLTTGVGVWKTESAEEKKITWLATVKGMEETVTFDAISTPTGANLVTAIADFDGFRHSSLSSFPPQTHGKGTFNTTTSIAYSYGNPNFLVSVGANQHKPKVARAGFSLDNGKNWQNFPSIDQESHPDDLVFGNVAVSSTDTNNIIWQPSRGAPPYFTKDRGVTWRRITWLQEQSLGNQIHTHLWNRQQALAADTVLEGTFYLYHQLHGFLLRTDDGGETWQIANENLPKGIKEGANLKTAPGMAGEVWLSLKEKGLYRSSNRGEDFTQLPLVDEVQVLGFGKAAPGVNHPTVFIQGKMAGELGVFRSTDLGKNWLKIADYPHGYLGQTRVLVGDMQVFGRVFIGSDGNGFIYGQIAE